MSTLETMSRRARPGMPAFQTSVTELDTHLQGSHGIFNLLTGMSTGSPQLHVRGRKADRRCARQVAMLQVSQQVTLLHGRCAQRDGMVCANDSHAGTWNGCDRCRGFETCQHSQVRASMNRAVELLRSARAQLERLLEQALTT